MICHESVALSYHNGTTTPCLSLSVPVSLEVLNSDKSAVLSPCVPPCLPVSVEENDYESEGRRFEYCRACPSKFCKCACGAVTAFADPLLKYMQVPYLDVVLLPTCLC